MQSCQWEVCLVALVIVCKRQMLLSKCLLRSTRGAALTRDMVDTGWNPENGSLLFFSSRKLGNWKYGKNLSRVIAFPDWYLKLVKFLARAFQGEFGGSIWCSPGPYDWLSVDHYCWYNISLFPQYYDSICQWKLNYCQTYPANLRHNHRRKPAPRLKPRGPCLYAQPRGERERHWDLLCQQGWLAKQHQNAIAATFLCPNHWEWSLVEVGQGESRQGTL